MEGDLERRVEKRVAERCFKIQLISKDTALLKRAEVAKGIMLRYLICSEILCANRKKLGVIRELSKDAHKAKEGQL